MKTLYIKIEGMHCSHCEEVIRSVLLQNNNIKEVSFDGYIACVKYTGNLNKNKIINSILEKDYITKEEYISDNINDLKDNIKLKEFLIITIAIALIVFLIYKIFNYNIFNVIPTIDSSITYGMLVLTGLLTSIHCISMCGAINLMATIDKSSKRNIKKPLLYNTGRIISYTIIGGIVGLVGSVISISSTVSGIIIILASLVMFLMSLSMLGILKIKGRKFIKIKTKSRNPFIIGLLNGFINW